MHAATIWACWLNLGEELLNTIIRTHFGYLAEAIEVLIHPLSLGKPQIKQALIPVVIPSQCQLFHRFVDSQNFSPFHGIKRCELIES